LSATPAITGSAASALGPPEREVGHERDTVLAAVVDERVVLAVHDAVGVLDLADGPDEFLSELDALQGDRRHADQVELALLTQVGQDAELLGGRDPLRLRRAAVVAQVDEVHALDVERAQVLFHLLAQLVRLLGGEPAAVVVARGADLGDEPQPLRIGEEGLADEVVDDVRPVELGGVDVVDTELDRAAQDRAGGVGITWRAEYSRPCELHGAEADPADRLVAEKCCLSIGHDSSLG
jgi:hypothetical protein